MGIGLLSLPLAFKYSGWVLGGIILSLSGLITLYTARILSRCMEVDPSLITYADIGWCLSTLIALMDRLAFGNKHRVVVSLLFPLELTATWYPICILQIIVALPSSFFLPIHSM